MELSKDQKTLYQNLGKLSAEKRLKGLTKEEISEVMKKVRNGKKKV